MMTSWNGSIFPLWGEYTGHRRIPLAKASNMEQTAAQTTDMLVIWVAWRSLWRHCNENTTDHNNARIVSMIIDITVLKTNVLNTRCFCIAELWRHYSLISHQIDMNIFVGDTWSVHYDDVIMGAMASKFTSLAIVYWNVYSDADQRKHQSSASLAFVWGIHRGTLNSPHKWPVTRKMFPFHDVIKCNTFCLQ